jgi:crotonobetainyl-CoA:carnitine CoA-transferase CaiB-like acyl-CoA transferase
MLSRAVPGNTSASAAVAPMPLEGVTILDASAWLTGAGGTSLLADLGANVIKVEQPFVGDNTRMQLFTPKEAERGVLALYELANRNKRGIAIDLKHPAGKDLFLRLARHADVVTENFRTGTMEKYGLGYDALSAANPSVILVSANGFGRRGPDAPASVIDMLGHARSGLMRLLSDPYGETRYIGAHAIADETGAIFFAFSIMAGLLARALHGHGQHIDSSQLGALMTLQTVPMHVFLATGQRPWKELITNQKRALAGPYTCADGRSICFWGARYWEQLCALMQRTALLHDPRFSDDAARREHDAELYEEFAGIFKTRTLSAWDEAMRTAGIPASPVNDYEDLLTDPQVIANGYITEVDHPTAGRLRQLASPLGFSKTKPRYRSAAPTLGQHTDEVLAEYGVVADEIARLRADRVIQ